MSVNGDHSLVEDELSFETPVPELDGFGPTPSSQQSVVHQYAFLKRLRVLHYLGNLYSTRVVPAFEEWQKLSKAASDWISTENDRRETRRTTIEAEIQELRQQRDKFQRERETAEVAYWQAHARSNENQAQSPLLAVGGGHDQTDSRSGGWLYKLAAAGGKIAPYFGPPAAVVCGSVLGLCFGTLFGITSLDDLQKGEGRPFALCAMAVGFTIVFLLGKGMDYAVRMYADRVSPDRGGPSPFNAACAAMTLFMAAEVFLEGFGLREVHRDYLTSLQHQMGVAHELPLLTLPTYLLLGVLVSGPYLCCKLGGAWYRARAAHVAASAAVEGGSPNVAGVQETAERLVIAAIQCRQLQDRCDELDRRIGRLREEHRALEPVDAPSGALLEQVRAAEAVYRTERDRYEKLLESLVLLRSPHIELRNRPSQG